MTEACSYLQSLLYKEIPLCQALQVSVESWQSLDLKIKLPLAPNTNHLSTMFGGSLYCGAVLVGWGWVHLRLRELGITNGHIVIHGGRIDYSRPVLGDATAICSAPDETVWRKFEAMFKRYGKGRLVLKSSIMYDNQVAVSFEGEYVVYCND